MNLIISDEVLDLYRQMDEQTSAFQASTGLQCPAGCGRCCDNPQVETTPLEMLPLAMELIQRGEASIWLEQLRQTQSSDICLCFEPDPAIPGNGRCRMYPWRPSLCRLFGFAATFDKAGKPVLAACFRHKEVMPDILAHAQAAVTDRSSTPQFVYWQARVASLAPNWNSHPMPINRALQIALEKVSLVLAYQAHPAKDL